MHHGIATALASDFIARNLRREKQIVLPELLQMLVGDFL